MASQSTPASGSLADRITKPESSTAPAIPAMNATASSFQPASGTSWADEVNSPSVANPPIAVPETAAAAHTTTTEASKEPNIPQMDGATEPFNGSSLQEPDYAVDIKLADMQADPNHPLFSVTAFEDLGLNENILKGITNMNFRRPSKVQEKTLPLLMMDPPHNLIGQSQSGTGKTAAFVLNILYRIDLSTEQACNTPQALVLAPSRELARQIVGVVKLMGAFLPGLKVEAAVPVDQAMRARKIEAAVVVGTPGTVMDMIRKRSMNASRIKILVLDEADNMLDQQGLGDQCIRTQQMLPKNVQTVLFSATFPEKVVVYAQKFAPGANQMTLRHEDLTVEGIKQIYLDCNSDKDKYDVLVKFYGLLTIGSSIIFVKTRDTAAQIERRMVAEGHKVVSLTGAYEGAQRDSIIDAFRLGQAKVLIATNVLSRGIDVQSVSMVVNYDVPDMLIRPGVFAADPQTYLHRIGRTGRFGRVGVAVTFISSRRDWEMLMEIQKYFGAEMTKVATDDWDELEETVTRIIKSSRSGTNFQDGAQMQG